MAKEWLNENPTESMAVAARLYHLSPTTLRNSIARGKTTVKDRGGQNRVLSKAQIEALKDWIKAQSIQGLGATKKMVYAAVCHLRHPQPEPSMSWLTKFIKRELHDEFHMIKTKPIALQRVAAQDYETITNWFYKYQQFLIEKGIKGEDIWNMDETGFRVGIPGGQTVIVPCNVTELYTPSPKNRISITIIESVCSNGTVIAPVLIIPGKTHMESWYHENLAGEERILLSESGYSNDELAIIWLQHFIKETKCEENGNSLWKLIILDSHTSHMTPELRLMAAQYNIHLFTLPAHLTHVLQPLDVGIFQPYKHWHKEAVHSSIRKLDLSYTVSSFIRDLPEIRANTFKASTVIHAFRNSGIWPVDREEALSKLQKYSAPQQPEIAGELPSVTLQQTESQLNEWKARIPVLLSSPSRRRYSEFIARTEQVLAKAQLTELDLGLATCRETEQRKKQATNRRTVQKGGHLSVEEARDKIDQKAQLAAQKAAAKVARAHKKLQTAAKQALHQAGVTARRAERDRKKRVAALTKARATIPEELQDPIPNPEAESDEAESESKSESDRQESVGQDWEPDFTLYF